MKNKASAIVSAYNEEKRIGTVLKALSKSKNIGEIIVIDDGSKDNTQKVVKKFSKIIYIKNKENRGKAYCMGRGVGIAKNETIFFCDSDLKNFSAKIADEIIFPVINEEYDMFLGVRANKIREMACKLLSPNFILITGQRAIKKDVWKKIPAFYKKRYRIEIGMNYFMDKRNSGYGFKYFRYGQVIKERKVFWNGEILRWKMNVDIALAIIYSIFFL